MTTSKHDNAAEPTYPCERCGTPRTKAQGGTVFTVCDVCWDKNNAGDWAQAQARAAFEAEAKSAEAKPDLYPGGNEPDFQTLALEAAAAHDPKVAVAECDQLRAEITQLTVALADGRANHEAAHAAFNRAITGINAALTGAGVAPILGVGGKTTIACVHELADERDAYRAMICDLLASARPHPIEHPTMTKQWERARALLKDGPLPRKAIT